MPVKNLVNWLKTLGKRGMWLCAPQGVQYVTVFIEGDMVDWISLPMSFFAVSTSKYVPGTQPDASERSYMTITILKISKKVKIEKPKQSKHQTLRMIVGLL